MSVTTCRTVIIFTAIAAWITAGDMLGILEQVQ